MSGPPSPTPERPEAPVHSAARRGDLAELERLLAHGADLNAFHGGLTPLMAAAGSLKGASVETLRWLVEHGADLRLRSEDDWDATAAWYASGPPWRHEPLPGRSARGFAERLRFLLDAGLDAREYVPNGRSLLTEAARVGDPLRVKLLL